MHSVSVVLYQAALSLQPAHFNGASMHSPSAGIPQGLAGVSVLFAAKLTRKLRLFGMQVMHTTIRALTIVLQQWRNQLPAQPLLLNMIAEKGHSKISYRADNVLKRVNWASFQNADLVTLTHVYDTLLAIPCGAGLKHPQGLITPLSRPELRDGIWRVKMPLGRPLACINLSRLRILVIDVLHGLAELHARGIVHRDIRKQNILDVRTVSCLHGLKRVVHSDNAIKVA